MTIVEGQIGPLKNLKEILNQNGISRFNSIGEINNFIKNYDTEKDEISKHVEHELNLEIEGLQYNLIKLQQAYNNLKAEISNNVDNEIKNLQDNFNLVNEKCNKSLVKKIIFFPLLTILKLKKTNLEKNYEKIIHRKTFDAECELIKTKNKLDDYSENKEQIVLKSSLPLYEELVSTKEVVEGLRTIIAGAIGENLVVKKLQDLSDKYILFNDFSIEFNPPIFNRKENDRIYSIQIDHLLIANSGIFILETKNWSKQSIKNLDLRSPIKQILRTSYAVFVLLNSESEYNEINLNCHHWGNKQIPIKNIIVMINEKPRENFKYVKILSLNELNGYITYFDPIFSDEEVKIICDYLSKKQY